jgi:hypothetical protein
VKLSRFLRGFLSLGHRNSLVDGGIQYGPLVGIGGSGPSLILPRHSKVTSSAYETEKSGVSGDPVVRQEVSSSGNRRLTVSLFNRLGLRTAGGCSVWHKSHGTKPSYVKLDNGFSVNFMNQAPILILLMCSQRCLHDSSSVQIDSNTLSSLHPYQD